MFTLSISLSNQCSITISLCLTNVYSFNLYLSVSHQCVLFLSLCLTNVLSLSLSVIQMFTLSISFFIIIIINHTVGNTDHNALFCHIKTRILSLSLCLTCKPIWYLLLSLSPTPFYLYVSFTFAQTTQPSTFFSSLIAPTSQSSSLSYTHPPTHTYTHTHTQSTSFSLSLSFSCSRCYKAFLQEI